MHYTYNTVGVCSTRIDFDVEGGIIHNVVYQNGCHGNLQAIGRLIEGMEIGEAIRRLKGIKCGYKQTSCGDQLAVALEGVLEKAKRGEN